MLVPSLFTLQLEFLKQFIYGKSALIIKQIIDLEKSLANQQSYVIIPTIIKRQRLMNIPCR